MDAPAFGAHWPAASLLYVEGDFGEVLGRRIPAEGGGTNELTATHRHHDMGCVWIVGFRRIERTRLRAVGRGEVGVVIRMRMIDREQVELAPIDFVEHRQ